MLLTFPGPPLPMPRHRSGLMPAGEGAPRNCPRCKKGLRCRGCGCPVTVREYPAKTLEVEKRRMLGLVGAKPPEVLVAPLEMWARFRLTPPDSWPKWRKNAALSGHEHPIGAQSGDIDNLAKTPMDVLQDWLWQNDSQVVTLVARKLYAAEAGVDLYVRSLPRVLTADEWRSQEAVQREMFV